MPTLLSSYADPRFYARHPISALARLADGTILTLSSTIHSQPLLQRFDGTTGELRQTLPLSAQLRSLHEWPVQEDPGTGELTLDTRDPYADPQPYSLWRLGLPTGDLAADRIATYSSGGYFSQARKVGGVVYVASLEGLLVLDATTGAELRRFAAPFTDKHTNTAISPDGRLAAFSDDDSLRIVVLDTTSGELVQELTADGNTGRGARLLFSPDGTRLLAAGVRLLEFWELATGTRQWFVTAYGSGQTPNDYLLAFSPDGQHLAASHHNWGLHVIDAATGDERWEDPATKALCFSADGQRLYLAFGHRVVPYEARSGVAQPVAQGPDSPWAGRLYPGHRPGQLLAVGRRAVYIDATTAAPVTEVAPDTVLAYWPAAQPQAPSLLLQTVTGGWRQAQAEVRLARLPDGAGRLLAQRPHSAGALSERYAVLCHDRYQVPDNARSLTLYDAQGNALALLSKKSKQNMPFDALRFFPDGVRFAGAGLKFLAVWDAATRQQLWRTETKGLAWDEVVVHESQAYVLAYTGKQVLVCFDAATGARLWDYQPRKGRKGDDKHHLLLGTVLGRGELVLCVLSNGELIALDAATGALRHQALLHPSGNTAAVLTPGNQLTVTHYDSTLAHYDLHDWLGPGEAGATAAPAAPFQLPPAGLAPAALAEALAAASWAAFDWQRDAEPLRQLLATAEAQHGVGEAHRLAMARLLALSAAAERPFFELKHPYGRRTELVSLALSPDGRHLATGRWLDSEQDNPYWFEDGGEVQIWDLRSGHLVNSFAPVLHGVGWPDYAESLKWSPDGTRLGMSYCTNLLGVFDPFASQLVLEHTFDVTDGYSRPASWCWQPDGKALFISCWPMNGEMAGMVLPLERGAFPLSSPYGFHWPTDPALLSRLAAGGTKPLDGTSALTGFRWPEWSTQGYIFGSDGEYAYTLDPQTRQVRSIIPDKGQRGYWLHNGSYFIQPQGEEQAIYNGSGNLLRTTPAGADPLEYLPELARTTPDPDANPQWVAATRRLFQPRYRRCIDSYSLAYSPDGQRAATLSPQWEVTIWDLRGGAHPIQTFTVDKAVDGLLLGADDRLVATGPGQLFFYDTSTGDLLNHYDPMVSREAAKKVARSAVHGPNSLFSWQQAGTMHEVAVFPSGLVVAPAAVRPALTAELSYVLNNHSAWPYRWATPHEANDLAAAPTTTSPLAIE